MQVAQFGGQMAVEFATKGGLLLDAYLATLACLQLVAKFTINQITPGHGVNFWVRCPAQLVPLAIFMLNDANTLLK